MSSELGELLYTVIHNNKINSESFLYKLIKTQLQCLLCDDVRQFRFDSDIIHWGLTLQYYGGQQLINILRGLSTSNSQSHGSIVNNPNNWRLYLPSNSTLRKHAPPVFSAEDIDSHCSLLKELLQSQNIPKLGGLAFDEIEIRYGITYLQYSGKF